MPTPKENKMALPEPETLRCSAGNAALLTWAVLGPCVSVGLCAALFYSLNVRMDMWQAYGFIFLTASGSVSQMFAGSYLLKFTARKRPADANTPTETSPV